MRLTDTASPRDALQKRVRRLLHLDRRTEDSSDLRKYVLPLLNSLGSAALIGGAIRDVARGGTRAFSSDLDFVIHGSNRGAFVNRMKDLAATPNRFGGYALKQFSVKIDVWHIEDTWARTAGHIAVDEPEDLLNCTFFDWDSVVFDLQTGRLILPKDYFGKLSSNVMDIRLEHNPNRMGSLVRALRRAAQWHVRFGPRLTEFSIRCLQEMRWDELVQLDERAFSKPLLRWLRPDVVMQRLHTPYDTIHGQITDPVPEIFQLDLPVELGWLQRDVAMERLHAPCATCHPNITDRVPATCQLDLPYDLGFAGSM